MHFSVTQSVLFEYTEDTSVGIHMKHLLAVKGFQSIINVFQSINKMGAWKYLDDYCGLASQLPKAYTMHSK